MQITLAKQNPAGMLGTMKIGFISLYLPTGVQGGVPVQVDLLAGEYARRGHDVVVYSMDPAPAQAPYHARRPFMPPAAERRVAALRGWGIYAFPWYLAREDFSSFDVIHAHGDSHFIRATCPVVRTFHSSGLDEAIHARTFRRFFGLLGIYPFEWWSGRKADRCVYVSSSVKRFYPGLPGELIPNAVDLSRFYAGGSRTPDPTILFVAGTFGGRKRGALLVKAFQRQVRRQLPRARLRLVCPEPIKADGVDWMGIVSTERLVELYRSSWLTCLPSSHENFGVPLVESMACGTPVVATFNAGAREVLEDGRWGALTTAAGLGQALISMLTKEDERNGWTAKGLERARQYSLARIADRYLAIFEGLRKPGAEGSGA